MLYGFYFTYAYLELNPIMIRTLKTYRKVREWIKIDTGVLDAVLIIFRITTVIFNMPWLSAWCDINHRCLIIQCLSHEINMCSLSLFFFRTGLVGPKGKRVFLFFRGLLGSGAMILLYYAYQVMPLADATVITFSSPVFTSLFAWIFLKEKYSLWELLFTLFTITGVVLIARPPFLFGSKVSGIQGSYTNHLKGTIAAVASAVSGASTFVILRKMGKSVHYFLSIWYYAVIGLIVCVITLFVMDEWSLPYCGIDRFLLILIGLFGLGGQIFLTKALQIEKAGPVAIMKTMDVVFAFIFQIIFLNHLPTWWTVGGALCVVASSSGTVLRKWYQNSKTTQNEI